MALGTNTQLEPVSCRKKRAGAALCAYFLDRNGIGGDTVRNGQEASVDEIRVHLDDLRFDTGDTTVTFMLGPVLWFGYVRAAADEWACTNGTDL